MRELFRSPMEECFNDPDIRFLDDMKVKFRKNREVDRGMLMKMAGCMMTKIGFVNEEGEIMQETMKEKMGSKMKDFTKFDEMMEMCDKKMDTIDHTSLKLMECIKDFLDEKCGC